MLFYMETNTFFNWYVSKEEEEQEEQGLIISLIKYELNSVFG